MKTLIRLVLRAGGALMLSCAAAAAAAAAAAGVEYPDRPVELLVPFAAGSAPDTVARLLAASWNRSLHAEVVVQNRPGAAGSIAVAEVARAKPDGYTLVLSGDAAIVVNPAIYAKLSYDPQHDLAPISQVVAMPNVLVVGNQVPAHSVDELVALARAHPGTLSFASVGAGTSSHRAGELFRRGAGIDILHVPYKSSPLLDVVEGRVTMFFANPATALPLIRDGRLRALAGSALERLPFAPELPTMAECGFPGFEAVAWFGLLAPAGTPGPVLERLQSATSHALAEPEVRERLQAIGAVPIGSTSEAFRSLIATESPRWARLMRDAGIHAD